MICHVESFARITLNVISLANFVMILPDSWKVEYIQVHDRIIAINNAAVEKLQHYSMYIWNILI